MGGPVPAEGEAGRPHSRDEEHPARLIYPEAFVETISLDPAFRDGWYEDAADGRGSRPARQDLVGDGVLDGVLEAGAWRLLGFASADDFQIGFVDAYFQPLDPNDLLA
jgi:homoserine O-acetyltransferase/O-succinyltransferase